MGIGTEGNIGGSITIHIGPTMVTGIADPMMASHGTTLTVMRLLSSGNPVTLPSHSTACAGQMAAGPPRVAPSGG